MKVEIVKDAARRWRWHLTDAELAINAGSTRTFFWRWTCRRDFKKRYTALIQKRKYWPAYRDVEICKT